MRRRKESGGDYEGKRCIVGRVVARAGAARATTLEQQLIKRGWEDFFWTEWDQWDDVLLRCSA